MQLLDKTPSHVQQFLQQHIPKQIWLPGSNYQGQLIHQFSFGPVHAPQFEWHEVHDLIQKSLIPHDSSVGPELKVFSYLISIFEFEFCKRKLQSTIVSSHHQPAPKYPHIWESTENQLQ
eukprot:TRINITY_DN25579_c0_g1_i1.p1 TRINITY_DN25579_c0_g1~~TRINITY_DN25579_c0_g1_i1.p1  ORF type:complete len:119 (-),score=2.94 TRINITY_DN25579_c0_g1_i1:84-440(-)